MKPNDLYFEISVGSDGEIFVPLSLSPGSLDSEFRSSSLSKEVKKALERAGVDENDIMESVWEANNGFTPEQIKANLIAEGFMYSSELIEEEEEMEKYEKDEEFEVYEDRKERNLLEEAIIHILGPEHSEEIQIGTENCESIYIFEYEVFVLNEGRDTPFSMLSDEEQLGVLGKVIIFKSDSNKGS